MATGARRDPPMPRVGLDRGGDEQGASGLADKLAGLDLTPAERLALDELLTAASASRADAERLVADPGLIAVSVQRGVIARTARAAETSKEVAAAAFADALSYLGAVGAHSDWKLPPSPLVDEAWHQFILYTQAYARYCGTVFGHFVHHCPGGDDDDPGPAPAETYARLTGDGHPLTAWLWLSS